MSEPVVVNTGPLLALGACGQLGLLRMLHARRKLSSHNLNAGKRAAKPLALEAERPGWLEVAALVSPPSPLLTAYLDAGEAAVIALALEQGVRRVVIDERRARMVARTMGLEVAGSVGILLRAKRQGLIAEIKPSVEVMRTQGIWLSERLLKFALSEAGET